MIIYDTVNHREDRIDIRQPRQSSELAKLCMLELETTRRKSKLMYHTMNKELRAIAMVDANCALMFKHVQSQKISGGMQNADIIEYSKNLAEQHKPGQECVVLSQVNIPANHS